ncbi:MAG: recombination mediator RecR [Candidatus Buchananbacteria bacterium]|nr:recombination mediator RecR [Candidatus Buchananbacteria bacterium]
MKYPLIIQNLIDQFSKLPSIGPKSAERLVFHLLYQPQNELHEFSQAIDHLKINVRQCQICFNFSESDPCYICSNPKRNKTIICVVAKPQDMAIIEKTGSFEGVYHILGGNINPLENISPQNIKIKELLIRIKNNGVKEIILALNPDMSGETTSLYLSKLIKQFPDIKITRLARGLPMGADLEYADEITLENALKDRKEL